MRKTAFWVLSNVFAGVWVLLDKRIEWMTSQMFIVSASAKEISLLGYRMTPLFRWGEQLGVGLPKKATAAEFQIQLTITDVSLNGDSLPEGLSFNNTETQYTYSTITENTIVYPFTYVNVKASDSQDGKNGLGVNGNMQKGEYIIMNTTIEGIEPNALIYEINRSGTDAENVETDYRNRVAKAMYDSGKGGSLKDFQTWGENIPGVINSFPYTGLPGAVSVYIEVDSSLNPDGIPPQDKIDETQNYIDTVKPMACTPTIFGITRIPVDVAITGLVASNLADVKANILEGLTNYFRSLEPYIESLSKEPIANVINVAIVTGVVSEIVTASGGRITSLTLSTGQTHVLADGQKAKLGQITYV